jgi:hypothetical protein
MGTNCYAPLSLHLLLLDKFNINYNKYINTESSLKKKSPIKKKSKKKKPYIFFSWDEWKNPKQIFGSKVLTFYGFVRARSLIIYLSLIQFLIKIGWKAKLQRFAKLSPYLTIWKIERNHLPDKKTKKKNPSNSWNIRETKTRNITQKEEEEEWQRKRRLLY